MIFEDDVPTVSLDGEQTANIRAWCQDSTWAPMACPPLSRLDRVRIRLSLVFETLATWVLP